MNDQTLSASPVLPPRTVLRIGIVATLGLLLLLCLFLASRRFGGAFDQPLSSPLMLLLGVGAAGLAGSIRTVWPRGAEPTAMSRWTRLLLPSLGVLLFTYALSLPGSAPWAVTLLWFLVVSEEGAWWLADTVVFPPRTGIQHRPWSPRWPEDPPEFPRRFDPHEVEGEDVTQQMTRLRDAEGSELIFGQARANFVAGERSRTVHLAFCPPLESQPQITVMHAGGPEATIAVAQAEPFGARFDVRLARIARQPESVMIEFEARPGTAR